MPREFLPAQRNRESRGRAELFPRSETGVTCGPQRPAADRMVREDRRVTKQELRDLVSHPEQLEHVRD